VTARAKQPASRGPRRGLVEALRDDAIKQVSVARRSLEILEAFVRRVETELPITDPADPSQLDDVTAEGTLEQFERLTAKMLANTEAELDEARRFNQEIAGMLASIECTLQETDRRLQLLRTD
jgi:hypothetical protein